MVILMGLFVFASLQSNALPDEQVAKKAAVYKPMEHRLDTGDYSYVWRKRTLHWELQWVCLGEQTGRLARDSYCEFQPKVEPATWPTLPRNRDDVNVHQKSPTHKD